MLKFFLFKRVLDRGPEQRESKLTVLCPLIYTVLVSYIMIYYIIIKLLDYLLQRTIPAETGNGTLKHFVFINYQKTFFDSPDNMAK